MNRFYPLLALFFSITLFPALVLGQTTLWQESFETDGQGTRYTASNIFLDSSNDYFTRTDGSDIWLVTGPYSGMEGSYWWAAEDVDDPDTGDGLDYKSIVFNEIDTTGYSNITFRGLFAAGNENNPGESNYDYADGAVVSYSVDGGTTWVQALKFRYLRDSDDFNEPFHQIIAITDTCLISTTDGGFGPSGGDCDTEVASTNFGPKLVTAAQELTFPIAGTPDSVQIRLECAFDAGSEEFAFDNFRLEGETACNMSLTMDSTDVTCYQADDGTATVTPVNGTPPYDFLWSNSATTATITGLSPDTYSVTVFDDEGCEATDEIIISEPSELVAAIDSMTPASSGSASDGTATASATGGTPPYSYSWSSGGSLATETGLSVGSYTVTVTDDNGCQDTEDVDIWDVLAERYTLKVEFNIPLSGLVASFPVGIDCTDDCEYTFLADEEVILIAIAADGFEFCGWKDVDGNSPSRIVIMDEDKTVYAEFKQIDASVPTLNFIGWIILMVIFSSMFAIHRLETRRSMKQS